MTLRSLQCSFQMRLFLLGLFCAAGSAKFTLPDEQDDFSAGAKIYGPWQEFVTEPNFQAAILKSNVAERNRGALSDEHFFVTLRTFKGYGPWGPQIFDSNLDLVFYASPDLDDPALAIQDPHVCSYAEDASSYEENPNDKEYQGRYICASDTITRTQGHLEVQPIVYDSSYKEVKSFDTYAMGHTGNLGIADGHEFHMLPDGQSFLSTVYHPRVIDISKVPLDRLEYEFNEFGDWVHDACFREVDIKKNKIHFQWCFLDHYDVTETFAAIKHAPTEFEAFDPAHINSVDKDKDGNYLISMKYISQLMKIAGPDNTSLEPGTVIWRLGGKNGTIPIHDKDLEFTFQHHARYVSAEYNTDGDEAMISETISVFDNHCHVGPSSPHWNECFKTPSNGKLIRIDYTHDDLRAELVQIYKSPGDIVTFAGGNMQILENGNVFIGWGQTPEATEYDFKTGEVLQHVKLGASSEDFVYRAPRGRWVGHPKWAPKMVAKIRKGASLDREKSSIMDVWASWNGATEVRSWLVSSSEKGSKGPWTDLGMWDREGFETKLALNAEDVLSTLTTKVKNPRLFLRVQALDAKQNPLESGEALGSVSIPPQVLPKHWAPESHKNDDSEQPDDEEWDDEGTDEKESSKSKGGKGKEVQKDSQESTFMMASLVLLLSIIVAATAFFWFMRGYMEILQERLRSTLRRWGLGTGVYAYKPLHGDQDDAKEGTYLDDLRHK